MDMEHLQSHTQLQDATTPTSSETNSEHNWQWERNPNVWIRKRNDQYFATIGNYKVTQEHLALIDLEAELYAPHIGTIVAVTGAMIHSHTEYEKTKKSNTRQKRRKK